MTLRVPRYVTPWESIPQFDTRGFGTNAWVSVTNPDYGPIKQKYAAFGKSIHGVHHGNYVTNTLDFGSPIQYNMAGRFNTGVTIPNPTPTNNDYAWNGNARVRRYAHQHIDSIASGYLAGSVRMFKIPGVPVRTPTDDDIANKRAWKNYSLISTHDNYIHGTKLGKNHGVFGLTPGNCFNIAFVGSTGSASVSRKFIFNVQRIGQFGVPAESYNVEWNSGSVDRSASAIITAAVGGAAVNFNYGFKILDWNSSGSKCILAGFIHNSNAIEDDGVNQLHTWPFAYVEFSFSIDADNKIVVSGSAIQRYLSTASANGNSHVVGAGAITLPGQLRKYDRIDGTVTPVQIGVDVKDTQVYQGPAHPAAGGVTIFEGTIDYQRIASTAGKNIYNLSTIAQDVGQARFVSNGTGSDVRVMRTIHMCYNASDTLVPVTMSFTAIMDPLVEVTKSINFAGQGSHTRDISGSVYNGNGLYTPYVRFVDSGSGTTTCTYVLQREKYSRKCIELRVGGTLVDYIQVEHTTPTVQTTYTIEVGYSAPGTGARTYGILSNTAVEDTTSVQSENACVPAESAIAGPLNWLGGYDALRQAGSITDFIRNTSVPDNQLLSRLRPFARVESNKLVSFNLGDDTVSVSSEDALAAGNWYFQQNFLLSGNHVRRTVYDAFNGRVALNNVAGFGNNDNPARNIPASDYHCTLNPIPGGESIINHNAPITIVGNA